jgi:hypothetical protein
MKTVLVRYKVNADMVVENETLVKEVYKQLHEKKLEGFHYTTLKLGDGVSFVHIAVADSEEANTTLSNLPAFKNFQAGIKERCEELPVAVPFTVVGAYDFKIMANDFAIP